MSLRSWGVSILVSGRQIGDCMATEDWFDVRGAVAWVTEQTMDKTIGMTRFWEQKYWLSEFSAEFAMAGIIFVVTMLAVLGPVWMERKLIARLMDHRGSTIAIRSLWTGEGNIRVEWWKNLPFGIGVPIGWINGFLWNNFGNDSSNPKVTQVGNRSYAGFWWALPGMINNFADFTKFAIKEHMPPRDADQVTYEVAPYIIISTTLLVFAFIPYGPSLYAANPDLSLVYMMAIFGIAPLGVFFAGWASNNKYTLIGGMRSAAQLTAYEIPLLVTVLGIAVLSGTLNIIEIAEFQMNNSLGSVWNIFLMPLGAALFLITMIAEVERTPFDMPEAEAELVEGWWTEYGGMRWGLLFASEYLRALAACILFSLFFLGGWEFPFEDSLISLPFIGVVFEILFQIVPHSAWLLMKAWLVFGFFIWVRASLHRVRTDQILEFGWRYLLPLSVVQLGLSIWLRLGVYDGGPWPMIVPILITIVAVALFVVLVLDEDEEALAEQRRPYHVSEINKASPGARINLED